MSRASTTIRRMAGAITASLLLLVTHPVHAQIGEGQVVNGRVTRDASKGYVFMRSPMRLAGTFLRVPDEQSLAEYLAGRAEEMAEEREEYARRLASWERRQENGSARSTDERPVEPTEADLNYPSFNMQTLRAFGPDYIYSQDAANPLRYAYLTVLPPGTYVWYGPVFLDPNLGYMGTCYCMGSVSFEVQAGVITDLGNYLVAAPLFESHPAVPLERSTFGRFTMPDRSAEVVYGLPASLSAWPVRRTEFHAVGKINNLFGVRVSRMAPIPGVLGYRRDAVIDERTGQELAPFVSP